MKKNNIITGLAFILLVTVVILQINIRQEQQTNLNQTKQLGERIQEYSSDSFWISKLARYELTKFDNIPYIVLEDQSYMMALREEMLEEKEAVKAITREIILLKHDYLDELDALKEYQVIDYILNNRTLQEDHTSLIKSYLIPYYDEDRI